MAALHAGIFTVSAGAAIRKKASAMSDGAEVAVTVRTIGGRPVRAKVRATDDGYVAVVDLPPTLIMDPVTDVPEMKRAFDAVVPVALRKRDEKRARDAERNKP